MQNMFATNTQNVSRQNQSPIINQQPIYTLQPNQQQTYNTHYSQPIPSPQDFSTMQNLFATSGMNVNFQYT